jgi:hypothetical protein
MRPDGNFSSLKKATRPSWVGALVALALPALVAGQASAEVVPRLADDTPGTFGVPIIVILPNPFYMEEAGNCVEPASESEDFEDCGSLTSNRKTGGPACHPSQEATNCRYGKTGKPKSYEFAPDSKVTARCMMKTKPSSDNGDYMWDVNFENGIATWAGDASWRKASDLSVTKNTARSGKGPSGNCEGYVNH